MKKSFLLLSISLSLCLVLLSACGSNSEINFISLLNSGSGSFKIQKKSSGQKFIVIPFSADNYSNDQDPSGARAFGLNFSLSGGTSKIFSPNGDLKGIDINSPKGLSKGWINSKIKRIEFENARYRESIEILKKVESYLKHKPSGFLKSFYKKSLNPEFKSQFVNYDLAPTLTVEIDKGKNVTGEIKAQTSKSALYIDQDYKTEITDAVAQSLLDTFDSITHKRVNALWGDESDIDANGTVILFLSGNMDDGVIGFFRPFDLLPQSLVETIPSLSGYHSNEKEIIFSEFPHGPFYKELIDATLAHEFFHLVNMSVKTLKYLNSNQVLISESIFLNEGMAHLTEDLTGLGFDAFKTAKYYLDDASKTSIGGDGDPSLWNSPDTLQRRGGMMLFLRYLFERKGGAKYSTSDPGLVTGKGADFLKTLNSSQNVGINNLRQAYGDTFENMFKNWTAALYIDGTGLSDDKKFNYDPEESDNYTNQKRGFDLRGTREAPEGGKSVESTIELSGPYIPTTLSSTLGNLQNFDSSVYESGGKFYEIDLAPNQELTIGLAGESAIGLGMTILRTQ